jgi:hypothetical protein
MRRIRAADDFEAIRLRLDELRRERQRQYGGQPAVEQPVLEPDAVAHVPSSIVRRYLAEARRSSSR